MDPERWLKLSPLLDALLEMEPALRAEHLQALEAQDAPLAGELRRLLELEAADEAFLAQPVVELPIGVQAGQRIGPYVLDRMLGEGGMGQVWLARRADGLYERKVALKLLRPGLADPSLTVRFNRERQILARLTHPHIARLLDAGIDRDGKPYLALEYVDGQPIGQWCHERGLGVPARLDLFRQICEAVSHAHANLVVHRDLKPSNILVTPDGGVRLLDFGIAKLLDNDSPLPEQTRTGVRTFTLHYAAPEQIRGEPVTTMTDVYSLGVVLYELLSGSRPYRLKRQTDAEWEEAILVGEPLRPSATAARADPETIRPYTPRRLARLLAGDLDKITLKALAKRPEQRYVSAEALSQDLQRHLRGQAVLARGESLRYRSLRYLSRYRWPIAAASVVVAALLGTIGIVSWQAQQAVREAARAQAMQQFVAGLLEGAGNTAPGNPIDLRTLLQMGVTRGDAALARQPQARAELYGMVARLRIGLGDYRQAGDLLDRQTQLLASLPDAPAGLQLESATLRGSLRRELGFPTQCVGLMRPFQTLARREQSLLPAQTANFFSQLGRCHREVGNLNLATRLLNESLALRRNLLNDEVGIAENMMELANMRAEGGDHLAAIAMLQQSLRHLQERVGSLHPLTIDLRGSLCSIERNAGLMADAERDCETALALALSVHGPDHRATIAARRQLASLHTDNGRFDLASKEFQESLQWMRSRLGEHHPDVGRTWNSVGIVAWELGQTDVAVEDLRRGLSILRGSTNVSIHSSVAFNLAMVLNSAGRSQEALAPLQEALRLRRSRYGNEHPIVGDTLRLLGVIQCALEQHTQGLQTLQDAVRITRSGYGETHSHTRRALISLAHQQALLDMPQGLAMLTQQARFDAQDFEQRKANWMAIAYLADVRCRRGERKAALADFDRLLAESRAMLPYGGIMPVQFAGMRDQCAAGERATTATAAAAAR